MWFVPVRDTKEATASRLLQRVMNVTDVVAACRDTGFEWLEQLLDNVMLFALIVCLQLMMVSVSDLHRIGTNNEYVIFIDA